MTSYFNGLFTLEVPDNWLVRDLSGAGAVVMQFASPNRDMTVLIFIRIPGSGELTSDDMVAELETTILGATFAQFGTDFRLDMPAEEVDDLAVEAEFSYEQETDAGMRPMLGYGYAEFVDNRVIGLLSAVDDEYAEELEAVVERIMESFDVDTTAPITLL